MFACVALSFWEHVSSAILPSLKFCSHSGYFQWLFKIVCRVSGYLLLCVRAIVALDMSSGEMISSSS